MISRNNIRARGPMMSLVTSPMVCALCRIEANSAAISCTPPISTQPTNTQMIAGSQPQYTAMAGPRIGPSPAMEAK